MVKPKKRTLLKMTGGHDLFLKWQKLQGGSSGPGDLFQNDGVLISNEDTKLWARDIQDLLLQKQQEMQDILYLQRVSIEFLKSLERVADVSTGEPDKTTDK